MSPETIADYRERMIRRPSWIAVLPEHLRELLDAIDPPRCSHGVKDGDWCDWCNNGPEPSPPADAVRVRIAVAVEGSGCPSSHAIDEGESDEQATAWVFSSDDTHRAIVVADIPKLRTPEVAGRVEEVSG